MRADTICCYCINKRMTRGIAESLHAYINKGEVVKPGTMEMEMEMEMETHRRHSHSQCRSCSQY